MHIVKFDRNFTRRHFLATMSKGAVAAGVLAPLWNVIAATGDISRAYPDEALSIEQYSKGAVKVGGVVDANNVDSVKDFLDPIAYHEIKNDRRVVDIIATPTQIMHLNPPSYTEATLKNRGRARFDSKGNVVADDGGPWIGGHPFPNAKSAQELMAGIALSWSRHDVAFATAAERVMSAEGELLYDNHGAFIEVQANGRLILDPKPRWPGHEDKLRYNTVILTAPGDIAGSAFLSIWHYDQTRIPDFFGYLPAFKRVRSFSANQRFEPLWPGTVYYASDAFGTGDPYLTWGNFKVVDKKPLLASVGGQGNGWFSKDPNWDAPRVGGKSGKKYVRTPFSLVPEAYVVEMEPISYPRSPYGKRRVWIDARTLSFITSVVYDRAGKLWKSFEQGTALYEKPSGEKYAVKGESYWSWTHVHIHDIQADRISTTSQVKTIEGYHNSFNDPAIYNHFCTVQAMRRLGI